MTSCATFLLLPRFRYSIPEGTKEINVTWKSLDAPAPGTLVALLRLSHQVAQRRL